MDMRSQPLKCRLCLWLDMTSSKVCTCCTFESSISNIPFSKLSSDWLKYLNVWIFQFQASIIQRSIGISMSKHYHAQFKIMTLNGHARTPCSVDLHFCSAWFLSQNYTKMWIFSNKIPCFVRLIALIFWIYMWNWLEIIGDFKLSLKWWAINILGTKLNNIIFIKVQFTRNW